MVDGGDEGRACMRSRECSFYLIVQRAANLLLTSDVTLDVLIEHLRLDRIGNVLLC